MILWSVRFSNGSNKSEHATWFDDKDKAKSLCNFSVTMTQLNQ